MAKTKKRVEEENAANYYFGCLQQIKFDSIAEFSKKFIGKDRNVRMHQSPLLGQYGTLVCTEATACTTSPQAGSQWGCCE